MPQCNPGGKFCFGISVVHQDQIQLSPLAVDEYRLGEEANVILSTGSRETGGFIVYRKGLLVGSLLQPVLDEHPKLAQFQLPAGTFVRHKGRQYCWVPVTPSGLLKLDPTMLKVFELQDGDRLIAIRSSNLAFTMGARGRLIERVHQYQGEIEEF